MRKLRAFTFVELLVLLAILAVLAALVLQHFAVARGPHMTVMRISCGNNLKEIGTAHRLWAGDNGDLVPAQQTISNGGWKDLLTNADQGAICWTNFAIMRNELGLSPKVVVCPDDTRQAAADFATDFKDNTHLSYFVGVSANDAYPQSLLGGDRNLGSGTKPDRDYGFSPESGKGNDVAISTNSVTGPVSWSLKIHSRGKVAGAGNILLGDGSVQQVSSDAFRVNWQPFIGETTNWPAGHVPAFPSARVVFP
jgi:type II secretory pathway pseudopilin PulG